MPHEDPIQPTESQLLDALFQSLPGLAWLLDKTGRFVRWNRGYQTLLGLSDEDLRKLNGIDVVVPRDRERVRTAMSEVLSGKEVTLKCSVGIGAREVPIRGTGVLLTVGEQSYIFGTASDISALLVAEAAATHSEHRYQAVFNATHDAMVIHGEDGRILDVNERWCSLFGSAREDAIATNANHLAFLEAPYSRVEAYDKVRLAAQVGPQVFEWPCKRFNGELFWTEVALRAATIKGEKCVIAAVRDISDRKRTEAALHENERRLALAVAATADAIWEWNLETEDTYFSPRWYEILGYADRQFPMSLDTLRDLCHPDDLPLVKQHVKACLDGTNSRGYAVESRMRRADGTWAWVLGRGAVVARDAQGKPTLMSGTNIDVTRRHQAEHEIAEWKRRYDLLSRAAGQIAYDCDVEGNIVWGDSMTPALGYGPDELLGGYAQWVERIHPDERDDIVQRYDTAGATEVAFFAEYRFRHRNGEYRWIEDTGYPLFDDQGKLLRYVGVMADVTEQKRAETERRRLEESLRHAQKLESIGRLAGGIAHDFNNLLTAISGNLSLAMLGEGGKSVTEDMLSEAARAAESAASLTRQLLTFSRKQAINAQILCLNDTVMGLEKMLRRLLGEDVELHVSLGSDLGQVESDEGQIEQILVNLAVNARDAMPHGGKLVLQTVNVTVDGNHSEGGPSQPGRYVMLLVSDSGIGMSPEVKEHLFEPFFTTKEVGKGTGLGLAMVYGAVQQNHGHIVVDSELGQGTSIRVYLPRIDASQKPLGDRKRPEIAGGVESIMVVEDDEQVRTLAVRILARQGYRVHAYGNGGDALVALSRTAQPVDLLLTDVIMPGMNGRDLAERAQQLRPGLRVLFTSGYTDDVIFQHGVLEQCIDFIPKPYSVETLTRRIREILDKAKATPSQ